MSELKLAGGSLHYESRGEGMAVLLLHAFPLGLAMWDPQASAFGSTHQVIRFDARGFGGSAPGDGMLTMERIADDALALLDELAVQRVFLVGLSMGGYAAFAFYRRHSERVAGLVLADTRAEADTPEGRRSRSQLAERVRKEGPAAAAEAFLPNLLGETSQRERPALVARVREMILANPAQGIVDGLMGLAARADSASTLREIRVPTLVLCGSEDTLTPPEQAEAMATAVRGGHLEVIPKAGHLASLENPEAFNTALSLFLLRNA